jgi:hypothetical protein
MLSTSEKDYQIHLHLRPAIKAPAYHFGDEILAIRELDVFQKIAGGKPQPELGSLVHH